jgi:hypothetical protein
LTPNSGSFPILTIGLGSEIRLMNIRVEASAKGYPKEFELLWFFTFPNKHFFSSQKAEKDAQNDFWEGIRSTLYHQGENIFSANFGELTITVFLKYLEKVRGELNRIITRKDIVEQGLQNFLELHYFLLYEGIPIVKKTRQIGSFRTDFTLELKDRKVMLIELQLNSDPLIVNNKPSGGLQEALMQVITWFNWIEKNDSSNLHRYGGKIIIGRRADYERNKDIIDNYVKRAKYPLHISTYDDLNLNIDLLEQVMSKVKERIGHSN